MINPKDRHCRSFRLEHLHASSYIKTYISHVRAFLISRPKNQVNFEYHNL